MNESSEKNNIDYVNISFNNQRSNYPKSKYCLLYFSIWSTILLLFIINYFLTINSFDDLVIVHISPEKVCSSFIEDHNKCINRYKIPDSTDLIVECSIQSQSLKNCYDSVAQFNRKCFLYTSELNSCIKDIQFTPDTNRTQTVYDNCYSYIDDIELCSNGFLRVDLDLLLSI